jgi:hypothetical protein
MEKKAEKLLKQPNKTSNAWKSEADDLWSLLKGIAGDIYNGAKTVLSDLDLNPAVVGEILALGL